VKQYDKAKDMLTKYVSMTSVANKDKAQQRLATLDAQIKAQQANPNPAAPEPKKDVKQASKGDTGEDMINKVQDANAPEANDNGSAPASNGTPNGSGSGTAPAPSGSNPPSNTPNSTPAADKSSEPKANSAPVAPATGAGGGVAKGS
jgi:hypothetical protein